MCYKVYLEYIQYLPVQKIFNPLNSKLNPICHLLASLGAHHILHFSKIRAKLQNVSSVLYQVQFYHVLRYALKSRGAYFGKFQIFSPLHCF